MATVSTQSIHIEAANILVIGDVRGEYDFIFDRIKVINNENGSFDLVLFVGDFFGSNGHCNIQSYINNEKKIDIECHFITTECKRDDLLHPDGNKVCDNLYYLGISIDDPCTIDDMLR